MSSFFEPEIQSPDSEILEIPPVSDHASKRLDQSFRRLNFIEGDFKHHQGPKPRQGLKLSLWMWLASTIDLLIVTGLSLCFNFLNMALIDKLRIKNFYFLIQGENLYLTLIVSSIFIGWMYFITTRVFFAASLGEKTCSLRLGEPLQRLKQEFTFKVILRSTITLLTGLILLPLLALIFRKDFAGKISGLYIYSLK